MADHPLPAGWHRGTGDIIATKDIDAFTYLDVVYDRETNKYRLWLVDKDGPTRRESKGSHDDLQAAFERAKRL